MKVEVRYALLCVLSGGVFSATLRGIPAFTAGVSLNSTTAWESSFQGKGVTSIPHAANDECASTLGVRMMHGYTDADARFNLIPGATVIFEVGGNIGVDLTEFVYKFESAKIFTFVPVPELYQKLERKFGHYKRVKIQQVGVSDANEELAFTIAGSFGTSSSHTNTSAQGQKITVQLRDANDLLAEVRDATGKIPDAVSINCEGCEYAVLGRMAAKGWLGKVPFVQMSWHVAGGVQDRTAKRCAIEKVLWQHYTPVWHSWYGWQGWRLKN